MTALALTGRCLCEALQYRAEVHADFQVCYCRMCQRWASGAFMGVRTTTFEVTQGAAHLRTFKSSDWAERGFCGTCGANLYYHATAHGTPSVAMGTLDDTSGLHVAREYYVDRRPADLRLANNTHAMTEAETLRYFGVADEG